MVQVEVCELDDGNSFNRKEHEGRKEKFTGLAHFTNFAVKTADQPKRRS